MTLTRAHRIARKRTSKYRHSNQQDCTVVTFLQVTTYDRNNGWWQKKFMVTRDDKLLHVVSEVSLKSVVFTVVCVEEECKQLTIYL